MKLISKDKHFYWLFPLCLAALFYLFSFYQLRLEPVLVAIATLSLAPLLHFALIYQKNLSRRNSIYIGLYAALLSLALMAQSAITYTGKATANYTENLFSSIGFNQILMALCAFLLLGILLLNFMHFLNVLSNKVQLAEKKKLSNKWFFLFVFFTLLVFWGLCWLTYFPGISFNDMYYILLKPVHMSIQHPFFYNMLLAGLVKLGEGFFGSINGGVALYCFVQLIVAALTVAYCIHWMRKKSSPWLFTLAVMLYFIFTPFFAAASVFITKDTFFGVIVMLFVPLLYDLWESDGQLLKNWRYVLKLSAVSIVTVLIRNNGIYVLLALALFMVLFFLKKRKALIKGFTLYALLGILLPVFLSSGAMRWIVKGAPYFQESIAIPLQQIARTVVKNSDQIPPDQEEFIYSIYPKEAYLEHYSPMSVDTLKWSTNPHADAGRFFLQGNKKAFLLNWAKLIPKNFSTYVEAYLMETYGYWSISSTNDTLLPSSYKKLEELGIYNQQIWPDTMQKTMESFYRSNYAMLREGNLFWLTLLFFLFVLISKSPKKIIAFIPVMAVWFTLMISAPVAFSIRYVYPFTYSLPFLVYISLMQNEKAVAFIP